MFILSLAIFAYFFHLLPAQVAVRFESDGTPSAWLGREAAMLWVLLPQFLLVLLAAGIAWGATKLSNRFGWAEGGWVSAGRVASLMGNIIALPQLIILFAMLDILGYNAYQTHFLPMWIVWLVILGLATIALVLVAVFIYLRARRAMSQPEE
jgi:magnesium-transporting ATPase (P-type)